VQLFAIGGEEISPLWLRAWCRIASHKHFDKL